MVLAAVDVSLPSKANISGALVLTPFFASVGARSRAVAAIGMVATGVAVGLAVFDGSGLHASLARIAVIVVGTVVAAQAARLRNRREFRLVDLSRVAEAAQRAIIRQPAPQVGSVAVATWYQSSMRAAMVGGDCYEALDTPFGTRLLISDVRGHGLASVRLAAVVVGAFRALDFIEPNLATVARELDMLGRPLRRRCRQRRRRWGSVRHGGDRPSGEADGDHRELWAPRSVAHRPRRPSPRPACYMSDSAKGIGGDPRLDLVDVQPSTRLLLYTDGLIEARGHRPLPLAN